MPTPGKRKASIDIDTKHIISMAPNREKMRFQLYGMG